VVKIFNKEYFVIKGKILPRKIKIKLKYGNKL